MDRVRLDVELARRKMVASRSQAESLIRLGQVKVNGRIIQKCGHVVTSEDVLSLADEQQYVSRAALKLQSADEVFHLDWSGRVVLDVGSSTGGFTQYALLHGASKVIAVDVGTDQMDPRLRDNPRIELYEKTDIRTFKSKTAIDLAVCDVSFISLRDILPAVSRLMSNRGVIVAMVKPQFEARHAAIKHKGVIKNDKMRREVLKSFETWALQSYKIVQKTDSKIAGSKGNVERFYILEALT